MEEQHPIPQNVTGFQFKLIGDMTIRQFAYLAANAAVAYFFYLMPIFWLLKWPVIFFFVLLGIALAFVPFQGRPLDRWIVNFFRAVFSSSQYVFKTKQVAQQSPPLAPPPASPLARGEPASSQGGPPPVLESYSQKEEVFVEPASEPTQRPPLQIPETPLVRVREPGKEEITPPHEEVKQPTDQATLSDEQRIQEEFKKIIIRKTELERELARLRKKPSPAASISKAAAESLGILEPPQVPNLISGIVKDTKGNVLQDILVEVKDKNGNLVRAFKTNRLGQFRAATTLGDGSYILDAEDPQNRYKFEPTQLVLEGKIILPLEIKNLDSREELRRKIFLT